MIFPLIVREAAQEDIREAVDWYDRQEFISVIAVMHGNRHPRRWRKRTTR